MPDLRILLINQIAQLLSQVLLLIICYSTARQSEVLKGPCDDLQQIVSVQKRLYPHPWPARSLQCLLILFLKWIMASHRAL